MEMIVTNLGWVDCHANTTDADADANADVNNKQTSAYLSFRLDG